MVISMREKFKKDVNMEKENLHGKMDQSTKVNTVGIRSMAKEHCSAEGESTEINNLSMEQ
jgi:hypothetical protein